MAGSLLEGKTGSVKPQLPGDTRWNSQLDCVDTYIRNHPHMLVIVAENEDDIDTRIKGLIHSVGLFNEAKHMYDHLKPIANALDKL